jgi:hypothetical protein
MTRAAGPHFTLDSRTYRLEEPFELVIGEVGLHNWRFDGERQPKLWVDADLGSGLIYPGITIHERSWNPASSSVRTHGRPVDYKVYGLQPPELMFDDLLASAIGLWRQDNQEMLAEHLQAGTAPEATTFRPAEWDGRELVVPLQYARLTNLRSVRPGGGSCLATIRLGHFFSLFEVRMEAKPQHSCRAMSPWLSGAVETWLQRQLLECEDGLGYAVLMTYEGNAADLSERFWLAKTDYCLVDGPPPEIFLRD